MSSHNTRPYIVWKRKMRGMCRVGRYASMERARDKATAIGGHFAHEDMIREPSMREAFGLPPMVTVQLALPEAIALLYDCDGAAFARGLAALESAIRKCDPKAIP